jgi:hypothetical protein
VSNPVRPCIGCTQTDDHPKHQVVTTSGESVFWHMDCHVLATGCDLCEQQTKGARGATGEALRAHLTRET